jgi:hypothetical protein
LAATWKPVRLGESSGSVFPWAAAE